jgi:hypothetical protein
VSRAARERRPAPCPALVAVVAVIAALAWSTSAGATQHLVRPGDSWNALDRRVGPGDEILLMPGRHKPATLEDLQGSSDRPIVIRGLDPSNPAIIEAERYGIRLLRPRFVRIEDLSVVGATISGIAAEGAPVPAAPVTKGAAYVPARATSSEVVLSRVTVSQTGPRGQRHAIRVINVDELRLNDCRVEGWAGSAVELVRVMGVNIIGCRFIGRDDHVQMSGVRVRGIADRVTIERCEFTDCGDQGVCIGGGSKPEELPPLPAEGIANGSLYEAARIQVLQCVFRGGECAVAFVNCERATVRNCTIFRPRRAVVSVRREQTDGRFGGISNCAFGSNLIAWEPRDVTMLTHVGPGADPAGIFLEENLWWSADFAETAAKLGAFPGTIQFPQVTDVDPLLDGDLHPQAEPAQIFGAWTP